MTRTILTTTDRGTPTAGPSGSSGLTRRRRFTQVAAVALTTVMMLPLLAATSYAATIPDFTPTAPPGGDALLSLGGNIKWVALIGIPAVFFAGLVCLGFGRIVDHRGAHRIGMGMTLSAIGVAIAVGAGIPFLNSFAK